MFSTDSTMKDDDAVIASHSAVSDGQMPPGKMYSPASNNDASIERRKTPDRARALVSDTDEVDVGSALVVLAVGEGDDLQDEQAVRVQQAVAVGVEGREELVAHSLQ